MRFYKQLTHPNGGLILAGIFLLGLVLRLGWIDSHGFWTDEVSSAETARNSLSFIFNDLNFGWVGNQTPWHYAFFRLLILPLDPASTPALVRLPSALAGAFLPLVVYGLGRELFSRAAGLVAAFLTALSPILLDHSHDARPYALLAFFTAASVFSFCMAERTGRTGWWVGFVAATCANLLNSYMAVTLVMPALAPYLVWALWRYARGKQEEHGRLFVPMLLSFGAVSIVGGAMALEFLRIPRTPLNWSGVSISSFASMPVKVLPSFTDFGLGGLPASAVSLVLLLGGSLGAYIGMRSGQRRGAAISVLLCLVPSFALAVMSANSLVFPRYVLFVCPFYFLLIGNAAAWAWQAAPSLSPNATVRGSLAPRMGVLFTALLCSLYLLGTLNYLNPATHHTLSYRPDFRGVAAYLSHHSDPQDTIIIADYPAHGYSVTNFYWHHTPPGHLYDARDPLLFRLSPQGNVYWVVSLLDLPLMDELAGRGNGSLRGQGWSEVVKLEDVVVLKEAVAGRTTDEIVDRMAARLDTLRPGYPPALLLRGGVLQARGDVAGAAQMYRDAVTGFWLGEEYLRTAEGFASVGLAANAWQEGIISKTMEPYRPEIHRWLAQQLLADGYTDESLAESRIADALQPGSTVGLR